ncbi:hypothetical protein GYMLUDRAFT_1025469 [Collybiopsis luxurians FD-317 M1]|nr:hypothetical protein GYMLUDRAFT_1025469 [Collybiopsis luxurians FD-317 M1]
MISITSLINAETVTYMKGVFGFNPFLRGRFDHKLPVSMLTLLCYNYLLSLAQEVTHIWNSKWGLVKILYLYSRYSPFIDTVLVVIGKDAMLVIVAIRLKIDKSCFPRAIKSTHVLCITNNSHVAVLLLSVPCLLKSESDYLTVESFLPRHVQQLSKSSRDTCCLLNLAYPSSSAIKPVAIVTVLTTVKWSASYTEVIVPGFLGCILVGESKVGIMSYLFFLVGETVYNYGFTSAALEKVIKTFYRDGVLYYLAILRTLLTLGSQITQFEKPELQILDTPFRVMHSILCCKLIIHIRQVARSEDEYEDTLENVEEITSISTAAMFVQ